MRNPALLLFLLLALPFRAAALEQWLYLSSNLLVDKNVSNIETLFARAEKAGYTHVLIADSKFGKLYDMEDRYFRNVERVKQSAAKHKLELVPALFGIGYSNDLLWKNPNLIEGLPVRDSLFVARGSAAVHQPDHATGFKGGDFSNLKQWAWHDPTVTSDEGAALIKDPKGENARISQKLTLTFSPISPLHSCEDGKLPRHARGETTRGQGFFESSESGREANAGLDLASRHLQLALQYGGAALPRRVGREERVIVVR